MSITTLDQALMDLEERLEAISGSIASIDETLEPHHKDGRLRHARLPMWGRATGCTAGETRRIEGRMGKRSEGSRNTPE